MKRGSGLQTDPHEDQKRQRGSPTSDPRGRESSVPDAPDRVTVSSSDTRQMSSAGPKIVVHEVERNEESFRSTEKKPERVATYKNLENVHGSPSPYQDNPRTLSTPRRSQSPAEGSCIPSTIAYILRFIFEIKDCPNSELAETKPVLLHRPESYHEIERVADKHAKTLSAKSIGSKELKFFYGDCAIVSDNDTKVRLPLRSPDDWTRVSKRVVEYWDSHANESLHLCISRHALASQEQPVEGKSFAKVKCWEIGDLLKTTWEGKRYIPHNVLETVISDHTIDQIIKEKPLKSVPQGEQHAFIRRVQAEGRIIFAMFVRARLKMECLKKLLDSGGKDSNLPLDESSQCHEECRHKFDSLLDAQGGFRAARFFEGEHYRLHSHAVVPLHFYSRTRGKNDLGCQDTEASHPSAGRKSDKLQDSPSEDKTTGTAALRGEAWCGQGAHSNVYCVKLNPNHHSLSEDLDACFALKELDIKQNLERNFHQELDMLNELRKDAHAHIVTHLATWTRDGRYYMLFPYAQCDLREYMLQNKFDQKDAFWLLDQFHGMAEAVKRVHDLSSVKDPTSSLNVTTSAAGERRTAWHHDIKPENILFFKDNSSYRGMFRLSDWGSAKNLLLRGRRRGLTIYGLWAASSSSSSFGQSLVRDLWIRSRIREKDKRNANSGTGITDDGFWHKVGNEFKLRPIVETQLQELAKALKQPSALPFEEIVGYIRRMLEIEVDSRIKARELCDILDGTIREKSIQAKSSKDKSEAATGLSLLPPDHHPLDAMAQGVSPSGQSPGPAYAELINLSPSDMSPRASRHSRNSSASELVTSHATHSRQPSNATHSRQSSNASNHSVLSIRERRGSHSSAKSPTAAEGDT